MKPKDLKSSFSWEERHPLLEDNVFYVPANYTNYGEFTLPAWSTIFQNDNPVVIEYCSGNGAWIAQKALDNPHLNWVAVEKKFKRVRKIWSKMKNHNISNLLVVCGEAETVTHHYFPEASFSEVFINFPDPWPKKRHAKHRLMQDAFVSELNRVMKVDGVFTLVTDDPDYSDQAIEVLNNEASGFSSLYPHPCFMTDEEGYGASYFDSLWREMGRTIRFHRYRNCGVTSDALCVS